ncbi:hypothetical protein HYPGJ_20320 [Hyphomicrobium sp. GJ21]|nr:hypothetical protein HYPGJ_20320 [Hyphomicrobium sp. GJ21]
MEWTMSACGTSRPCAAHSALTRPRQLPLPYSLCLLMVDTRQLLSSSGAQGERHVYERRPFRLSSAR